MDVPFRGMQRQHGLVYLAALEEPGSTGLDSQINFQGFPGSDQPEYDTWGLTGVSTLLVACIWHQPKIEQWFKLSVDELSHQHRAQQRCVAGKLCRLAGEMAAAAFIA